MLLLRLYLLKEYLRFLFLMLKETQKFALYPSPFIEQTGSANTYIKYFSKIVLTITVVKKIDI